MKPSTLPYIAGILMVISGFAHLIIWSITGESWEGALSIRKPVLFGISTGVTLISLGWIWLKLKPAGYDKWLSLLLAASLLIEVGLITLQYWRGEASHFNHQSQLNLLIDRTITVLIVFASIAILDIARRCFGFIEAEPSMKLAIRAGMGFLLVSCGLGFFILFYGEYLASRGESPTTFGAAGVMKFPHGITIHAVQYLPLMVWAMQWISVSQNRQTRAVQYATASLAMFLLFSLWQTFNGLARFDIGLVGGVLIAGAIGFAVAVLSQFVLGTIAGQSRNVEI